MAEQRSSLTAGENLHNLEKQYPRTKTGPADLRSI